VRNLKLVTRVTKVLPAQLPGPAVGTDRRGAAGSGRPALKPMGLVRREGWQLGFHWLVLATRSTCAFLDRRETELPPRALART